MWFQVISSSFQNTSSDFEQIHKNPNPMSYVNCKNSNILVTENLGG